MEASELRCGNKLVRPNGNIATVTWGVIKDVDNGDKTYQPIPLNEEWLLKFGFGLFPWGWVNKESGRSLRITIKYYFEREGNSALKIEYVHQLQNLYHAITKEELTVKQK